MKAFVFVKSDRYHLVEGTVREGDEQCKFNSKESKIVSEFSRILYILFGLKDFESASAVEVSA